MTLCAVILLLAVATEAVPTVSFPLNSQVPPVARVSQPFDFEFSPGTFTTQSGSLEYSLSGSPAWLSLDSPNRRLYGTPTEKDVGAIAFTMIAEDGTGSTPMQATLIVSSNPAPKLNIDLTDPLSKAGKLSGPQSLSLQPSKQYSIQFPADTFTSTSTTDLTYYATLSDRSPLPSWVSFDSDSMVFSGTASASPQTVDLMLIASDVTGFTGAWVLFTLSVSAHQLVFTNVEQIVNVSAGSEVSITNLRDQLSIDGKPLSNSDLKNATANPPDWLSFDPKTLEVRGTAPPNIKSTNFTVSAADKFGDVANTTVQLTSQATLFRGEVGNLNAIIGEPAKFDLSTVVVKQPDLQVEVDLGTAAQWLHFDESSLTIEGEIPASATPQIIQGSIEVTAAKGSQSNSESFDIVVKTATTTGSNGSTPRSASPTTDASTAAETSVTGMASPPSKKAPTNNGAIIAVSVVCVVIAIIALVLGYLLHRRSRRSGRPDSPRRRKEDISRPIYHEDEWQTAEDSFTGDRDVEKGQGTGHRTGELPPHIGTPSPLKKAITERRGIRGHKHKPSHTTSIGEGDREVLQSAIHSGDWSVPAGAIRSSPVSVGAGPSSRMPEDSPARGRRSRRSFRVHRDSQDSYARRSAGLPTRRRIHGMGHGRASFGSPSRRFSSRRSHAASSYSSFSTLSTGMLSNGLLSPTGSQFPAPPPSPSTTNRYSNAENRKSVRIVPGSPNPDNSTILADTRPLDERRQSYIRNRATSRSPFFAAHGSSRGSSSHRPSMIETLAESLGSGDTEENAARTLSPSSFYGSRSTTAGALASPAEERQRFPGSLRRRRTGKGPTARAYSGSSSAGGSPVKWRSTTQGTIGPLTGNAPAESPRSSMILSGLSDSAYTTTEGTGTEREYSNGRSLVDDPMDIDDPEELRTPSDEGGSNGSSDGPAYRPGAFMTSPLSPSALKINKQQSPPPSTPHRTPSRPLSFGKENDNPLALHRRTPSPTKSFKSAITTSPFHRRNRSTAGSSTKYTTLPASPNLPTSPIHRPKTSLSDFVNLTSRSKEGGDHATPSIDDLNHAALLRNSALASQQRRGSQHGGDAKALSAAVRQQLRQRDSIINRGRHSGRASSGGSAGRFSNKTNRGSEDRGKKRWSVLDAASQEQDDEESKREGPAATAAAAAAATGTGLRVPLSMISNVGNKTNFLAPPPSPDHPKSGHGRSGSTVLPGGIGLGNSGIREEEAVRLVGEGKAKRPVSVEGTNRWSSLRGTRETAAGAEREGAWKMGDVLRSSPGPKSSRPGTARESSVLGNEAFL